MYGEVTFLLHAGHCEWDSLLCCFPLKSVDFCPRWQLKHQQIIFFSWLDPLLGFVKLGLLQFCPNTYAFIHVALTSWDLNWMSWLFTF